MSLTTPNLQKINLVEKAQTLITRITLVAFATAIVGATVALSILNPPAMPAILILGVSGVAFMTLLFALTFAPTR